MLKKTAFYVLLQICTFLSVYPQFVANDSLTFNIECKPSLIEISSTNLGLFEKKIDTLNLLQNTTSVSYSLREPILLRVKLCIDDMIYRSKQFWALPKKTYVVSIKEKNLEINTLDTSNNFIYLLSKLEQSKRRYLLKKDNLVRQVKYNNDDSDSYRNKVAFIKDSVESLMDQNIYKPAILNNLTSAFGLYALCRYADRPLERQRRKYEPEKIDSLLSLFPENIQRMPSGLTLSNKILRAKELMVGKYFSGLTLIDTAGVSFKVSDGYGKYTLIEFWASWCAPCREESQQLIKLFKKYKNFKIISISIDEIASRYVWLRAIRQDGTGLWPQLSDFDNVARSRFDIDVVPSNFLLDKNGKILARDLRGAKLQAKIKELFVIKPVK